MQLKLKNMTNNICKINMNILNSDMSNGHKTQLLKFYRITKGSVAYMNYSYLRNYQITLNSYCSNKNKFTKDFSILDY